MNFDTFERNSNRNGGTYLHNVDKNRQTNCRINQAQKDQIKKIEWN